ncbi:MAG TPA: thiol reductant ABC exporter subunit CydC [Verrucomicrobia bacterium]|nr:MAG: thiol reductant ABC exporter subunit CydC [Lentisphaerae bacterium GWF2_57_35]HBA85315.1 thiol reductant ABC exporter subunit CydC [Verrucomicrobiota bacterium]
MKPVLFRLVKEARPYWKWMTLAALLSFFTIGSGVGLLMTAAYLIARAALQPSIADLQVAVVGVRFFGLARGIFRYLERCVSHEVTFRLLAGFRTWFYRAIEPLAPGRLGAYHSGDLLARAVTDVEQLEHLYVRMIGPPIVALIVTAALWSIFGAIDLTAAAILVMGLAAAGLGVPLWTQHLARKTGERLASSQSELQTRLLDGIQGLAELTAFNRVAAHTENILGLNDEALSLQRRLTLLNGLHESLLGLIMNLTVLGVLLAVVPSVAREGLNGIWLSVLTLGVMAAFEAVAPLPAAFQQHAQTATAGQRLLELIDAPPVVQPSTQPAPALERFDIQFQNVFFRYESLPILKDLNLSIPDGARVALVGPSGAGKSTMAHLLLRWYIAQHGEIQMGGQSLEAFRPSELTDWISYLPQHPHLFNGTIEDNLRRGNPAASDNELEDCIRFAMLDDLIRRLPHQRQTHIGEQGLQLSGGERRRLALARGLLRKSPILILDEPSADLDPDTERLLFQRLWTQPPARTLIVITHRLIGMENADRIFYLQDGTVRESGRHDELLQKNGAYRRMWTAQQQDAAVESLRRAIKPGITL